LSGIVGIVNLDGQPVDRQLLRQMTEYLAYRGPDAREIWTEGPVGMGHTMLRTTFEAEQERQPCSLEGQVWITADARLDGRDDLIRKLAARGCNNLKGAPDPELILHAYHVWGEDCLQHLVGDFAFAIWDSRRRRLFCARDHLGVKPFYYARLGDCLIFSNTLNCVRLHPGVSDKLNDLAIADFLLFDFNQDLSTTTFADIKRLPPAHYLTWQDGVLKLRRFWTLPQDGPLRYPRQRDYVEHFQELLDQAVADRLRTRRVGVFMSGGLDSPTVAAMAQKVLARQRAPFELRAYTEVFERLIPHEERHYAALVGAHLNIPIYYKPADDYQIYEGWDQPELNWPEPRHLPLVAHWIDLVKKVASQVRIVLTGEGGDILLSPSVSYFYRMIKGLRLGQLAVGIGRSVFIYGVLPQVGFKSTLRRWRGGDNHAPKLPPWFNTDFSARLNLPARWDLVTSGPEAPHPLRREAYQVLAGPFWPDYLEKFYDPGATGLLVEARHPLLDLRLVTYALALPPLPWCVDKVLIRAAGRNLLPETVRLRPKAPLAGDPETELMVQQKDHWVDHFVPVPELTEYVNRAAIPPLAGEANSHKLWMNLRPLSLNFWLRHWKSGDFRRYPNPRLKKNKEEDHETRPD
jgi:asparagine synthase (glutamine-hydrolysing)